MDRRRLARLTTQPPCAWLPMDRSIALAASRPFAAAPGMLEDALMHRSPRLLLTAVVTSTRCPGLTSRIQQALVLVCAAVACRCRSCVPHLRPSCARVLDPKPVVKISDSAQDHTWAHSRHTEPAHTKRRATANRHSTLQAPHAGGHARLLTTPRGLATCTRAFTSFPPSAGRRRRGPVPLA